MELLQLTILSFFIATIGVLAAVLLLRRPGLHPVLHNYLTQAQGQTALIPAERRESLNRLRDYVLQRLYKGKQASILFVCAENTAQSLLSQVWLETIATAYELPSLLCYSGGTQPTRMDAQIAEVLDGAGFSVRFDERKQKLAIKAGQQHRAFMLFPKVFDHVTNPKRNFAAVTTDAFTQEFLDRIPGSHLQLPIGYEAEVEQDLELLSFTIATEMLYLAREIKRAIDPTFVHQTHLQKAKVQSQRVPEHTVAA